MKIVLFTIWHELNYGAELQTYATVRILRELGCDVKVANIRLSDTRKMGLAKKLAKSIEPYRISYRDFYRFWKQNIPTTTRYKSLNNIIQNPPQADLYLVGSDQVWNPEITGELAPLFFLPFNNNIRKASYASSFGKEIWCGNNELTENGKTLLSKFDTIGCRESSGLKILKDIFNVNATLNLDPTLLHTSYSELTGDIDQNNSLVFYHINNDARFESFAQQLANILNIPLLNANQKTHLPLGKIVIKRTPIEEWIKRIGGATFVLTNSFHGLIFSLIYKRNFAVIIDSNKGARIRDLLASLNLSERIFTSYEELLQSQIWGKNIDYNEVNITLNHMREESLNYLKILVSATHFPRH